MRELIMKLSNMRAISGHEYRINKEIAEIFRPYCDGVSIDSLGSVIAYRKCSAECAPRVMIEAHMDEIGLMVSSVTDEGYITFVNVGGVDERILPSLEVTVHGKQDIFGVIGTPLPESCDSEKSYKTEQLAIDTGLDAKTVKELVSVGDGITMAQSAGALGKEQLSAKTMDDRASVAALIGVMKELCGKELCCDVYAVAAVQEEVGCRGGETTAFGIAPDIAIAVDVTHGITPDNSERAFETGKGLTISVGPNIHPRLFDRLCDTAQTKDIPYDIEVDGGATGTDAWPIQVSGGGVATALLSMPLKYMHTSVETLAVSDVEAVRDLIAEFVIGLESDISWLSL